MIAHQDISIVFQGKFPSVNSKDYQLCVANIIQARHILPGSPVLLGTWDGCEVPRHLGIDHIVFSKDPGSLPSFKKNTPLIKNNINRQIFSSARILKDVNTKYTIKLRLDCVLRHHEFFDYYAQYGKTSAGEERIAVPSFFTIDPRMYEQMPFHISDWFSFGPTRKLQKIWSAPLMTVDDATYYDRHLPASHSSYFDKLFRSRLAIEQHIATYYANALNYKTPVYHNDNSAEVLADHDKFSVRELLILDTDQFGIDCMKYQKVTKSSFQKLNCLMFLDWYLLNAADDCKFPVNEMIYQTALRRMLMKKAMRAVKKYIDPMMPIIRQPLIKLSLSKTLRTAIWLSNR